MRNKSPSRHCSHFCSKALFLPSIHSQQLFTVLAELQLIFTPSDTMAALKCHCTCLHLSSFSQCLWLTPSTAVLALWVLSWKIQTELSPLQRLLLSRCSSWCSSGFRKFSVIRKPSALVSSRILQTFLLLAWQKANTCCRGCSLSLINWRCRQPTQLQVRKFTFPDAERSIAKAKHKQSQAQAFDWSVTPCWTRLKFIAS